MKTNLIEKYLYPKSKKKISESSSVSGSSEFWFGYNRAKYIYVHEDEVLWSYFHEFPPGYIMTDEDRRRARALGYILLNIETFPKNQDSYLRVSDII